VLFLAEKYNFRTELDFSNCIEDTGLLNKHYSNTLSASAKFHKELDIQKKGIDKTLAFNDGTAVTVDEKLDKYTRPTIFLEMGFANKPSWLFTSEADYIFYIMLPTGLIYNLPLLPLRSVWKENEVKWREEYGNHKIDNDTFKANGYGIPSQKLLNRIHEYVKKNDLNYPLWEKMKYVNDVALPRDSAAIFCNMAEQFKIAHGKKLGPMKGFEYDFEDEPRAY
jgi:hypothetical protein